MSVVAQTLSQLETCGLICQESGLWRISLSGYPAVRGYLAAEGLQADAF
jgi:hypothetical protein